MQYSVIEFTELSVVTAVGKCCEMEMNVEESKAMRTVVRIVVDQKQ
jgi:hypothetical protein